MADKKISQLPASAALTGTEEVPVVQSGATVKTTVQDIANKAPGIGFTPENVANKSTATSLGTSDTLYPTQNAVKVYADTVAATKESLSNKSTATSLGTSNTLYPTQNAVKVYADTVAAAAAGGKELLANKSINTALGTSDTLYPTQNAVKVYVDASVSGLLDDRGSFTPSVTSPGAFPSTGGSGVGGAVQKGDLWFMSAGGFLGTTAVAAGATVRALVNTPGQTAANWNILSAGAISVTPPNLNQVTTAGNTSTNSITVSTDGGANVITAAVSDFGAASLTTLLGQGGSLQLTNTLGSVAKVKADTLGANRTYQLPDADGTLALQSSINLQAVTTNGNVTSDDILIQNNEPYSSFTVISTGGNGSARIAYSDTWKGHLLLYNGTYSGVVRANDLTASRQIQLPDADGTLAISSYKVYSALAEYSPSGLDVISILENTLGTTITWASGLGFTAEGTAGSSIFTNLKTVVTATPYYGNNAISFINTGFRISGTKVGLLSVRTDNNTQSAAFSGTFFIEIRVYP